MRKEVLVGLIYETTATTKLFLSTLTPFMAAPNQLGALCVRYLEKRSSYREKWAFMGESAHL